MRVLVGWNDCSETETLDLCLNVEDTEATLATDADSFLDAAQSRDWDTVLLALDFPSENDSFAVFERLRKSQPHVPVVGACEPDKLLQLPRFIKHGLSSYVPRDTNGDYIFLLNAMMESAYHAAEAERARQLAAKLQEEIASVRRLQESVIPQDLQAPPGYDIAARYEPSQIRILGGHPVALAGGDYYDVFSLNEEALVLLVGDASGHGMKACMSIMTMHTLIQMTRDQSYQNPAEFVTEVNRRLCNNQIIQGEGGFITLLYCVLNPITNTLTWSSAGHQMPLLHDLESNEVMTLGSVDSGSVPLGVSEEFPFDVCTAQLPPKCRVLLYTDGLTEAFPAGEKSHKEFGTKGIIQTLKQSCDLSAQKTIDGLFAASNAFTSGSGRHDDTSVVLFHRT